MTLLRVRQELGKFIAEWYKAGHWLYFSSFRQHTLLRFAGQPAMKGVSVRM
jgi:hypothetical protein